MLAPICLFTYNRLEETKETVAALQANFLAKESDLIIFSDGPKDDSGADRVNSVRSFLKTIDGFNTVRIFESLKNKGLANSIIDGVTQVIKVYPSVIVLEDDLVVSKNFLDYMNKALFFYEKENSVFSISGYTPKIDPLNIDLDIYYYGRAHSWGWATWRDRWEEVDWAVKDWYTIKSSFYLQAKFNRYGSDLYKMLKDFMSGRNNSWYVRFTYTQQKLQRYTVYPYKSKVLNFGFSIDATHCNVYNRTNLDLDRSNKVNFIFSKRIEEDAYLKKQLLFYKSLFFRVQNKLLTIFMRLGLINQRIYKDGI